MNPKPTPQHLDAAEKCFDRYMIGALDTDFRRQDTAARRAALIAGFAQLLAEAGGVEEGHVRGDHGTDFKILAWSVNPLNKRIYVELDATALD